MAVLKYRDPGTGDWVVLKGTAGPAGPAGPVGPDGEDGYTYTAEEADRIWLRIDGGNQMNAALDADGHRITNVAAGSAGTHAATVAQLPDPVEVAPVQVAAARPAARGTGDLWTDSSAPVLEWDTAWKSLVPHLTGGWVRWANSDFAEPSYRMLPGGSVELRGLIGHSTYTTTGVAVNLPTGYQSGPGQKTERIQLCHAGVALVLVTSTLSIHTYLDSGNGAWVSLAGIKYIASA